jgi:hypothetical protein
VAGSLPTPRTEAELLTRLPPTNQPGILPRELLPPGERVLFETRPSFAALYWGRTTFILLWSALWLGLGVSVPAAFGGGLFFASPAMIWLIVLYLQWRHRIYALTDQRVLRVSGVRGTDFQDASYAQIHNLTTEPGLAGGIRFDTTPPPSGAGYRPPPRQRPLRWDGIAQALRVYSFVQEAFAFELERNRVTAASQAAYDHLATESIRCQYCGGPIDIATLDPGNPRCPTCGAPVTAPA